MLYDSCLTRDHGRLRAADFFPGKEDCRLCPSKSVFSPRFSLAKQPNFGMASLGRRCLMVSRLEEERSSVFPPIRPTHYAQKPFLATSVLNACGAIDKRLGRQCTTDLVQPPPSFLPSKPTPLPYSSLTSNMSDQSGPSYVQNLFEAAFRDYERQTGKTLVNHPLAEKLQSCDTVESVTDLLREQTETSTEIRGNDKVLKPLKNVLSVLHKLSSASAVNFGQHLGLVRQ